MKTTKEEREVMARALELVGASGPTSVEIDGGWLRQLLADFAELKAEAEAAIAKAVAEEREAIAKRVLNFMPVASISAREMVGMYEITCWRLGTSDALEQAAAAIRARGAK